MLQDQPQRILTGTDKDIISYRKLCSFDINEKNICTIKGYRLLLENGWYHPTHNPNGVVRDHRLSIHFGYKNKNKIDPNIIGHIANCEFLLNTNNCSKGSRSSMTLSELQYEIEAFTLRPDSPV